MSKKLMQIFFITMIIISIIFFVKGMLNIFVQAYYLGIIEIIISIVLLFINYDEIKTYLE